MALSDSALSELLDALRVGDGTDLVRELAQWALHQLIEAEAAEKIGVGRYERSETRAIHRNGTRPTTLSTKAGDPKASRPSPRAWRRRWSRTSRVEGAEPLILAATLLRETSRSSAAVLDAPPSRWAPPVAAAMNARPPAPSDRASAE